jgi:hypothetical protein
MGRDECNLVDGQYRNFVGKINERDYIRIPPNKDIIKKIDICYSKMPYKNSPATFSYAVKYRSGNIYYVYLPRDYTDLEIVFEIGRRGDMVQASKYPHI